MRKTMRKSALLSSVAMLIVSAIVLTSATYAWFSSSKIVYVEEFDAKVTVTTGLLISVDKGANWGTSVDFKDAVSVNGTWGAGYAQDMVFDPVSSSDAKTWKTATYEETKNPDGTKNQELKFSDAVVGTDLVAVPLWVTGPETTNGSVTKVNAAVTFDADSQAAKCVKFALVPATSTDAAGTDLTKKGDVPGTYDKAVAATPNADSKFMGVSAEGSTIADKGAYITDNGTTISEVAADGGINFEIATGTTQDKPMMFIAYIWLEGNDADCDMLEFDTKGEEISFSMNLYIVE